MCVYNNKVNKFLRPRGVVWDETKKFEDLEDKGLNIQRVLPTDKIPAIRFLGIYMDSNLTFHYHTKTIISKLSKALYILRSVKHFLTVKTLLSICYSLFHSHLIYCLPIWSTTQQKI